MRFRSRSGTTRRRGGPCSWLALIPVGIICGIIGVFMLISNIALVANGVKTTGTVIGIDERVETEQAYTDEDGFDHPATTKTLYAPVIEFKTEDGSRVEYTEKLYTNFKPTVGSTRAIIYDKGDPQRAQNDSAASLWLWPIGLILFGLLALGAGIVGFILLKKAAKALLGTAQAAQQGGMAGAVGALSNLMGAPGGNPAAGMPPASLAPSIPQIAPPSPVNPQLAEYVRGSRAAGVDDATIRKTLADQGWSAPDIEAGLR